MDQEVLVKECHHLIKRLKQDRKHVALLMLKALDPDIRNWNLLVSLLEYDTLTTKNALQHFIKMLQKTLSQDMLKRILRVTILKTTDPFVTSINHAFDVRNSTRYIQSSVIFGIEIEHAIILESHSLPSVAKAKKRTRKTLPTGQPVS